MAEEIAQEVESCIRAFSEQSKAEIVELNLRRQRSKFFRVLLGGFEYGY